MANGAAIVTRLDQMFSEGRPEAIYLYKDITKKAVSAHKALVDIGGCSIKNDPLFGEDVATKAAQVAAEFNAQFAGQATHGGTASHSNTDRLVELTLARDNGWSDELRKAYIDLSLIVAEGPLATANFTVDDDNWNNLPAEHKRLAIELVKLEQAARDTETGDVVTPAPNTGSNATTAPGLQPAVTRSLTLTPMITSTATPHPQTSSSPGSGASDQSYSAHRDGPAVSSDRGEPSSSASRN
jgi:hypothetical protein